MGARETAVLRKCYMPRKKGFRSTKIASIAGVSKRSAEQIVRISKYPEVAALVKPDGITANRGNEIIRAIEEGRDYVTPYAKIPLDDPFKAAMVIIRAARKGRASRNFMKELASYLSLAD